MSVRYFSELLTNATKHVFSGRASGTVAIHLQQADGTITLTVTYDDVGLPEDFSMDTPDSVGTEIIQTLIMQLRGELEIDSSDQDTSFVIRFDMQ